MIELPGWNDLISVNGFCYSSSMGESPKLNIPLKTSVAPTKGIVSPTFTRNSTATYIDKNGVLQTAAVDVPRFQNGRYLVEPAATNLLAYSELLTASFWEPSNVTVVGDLEKNSFKITCGLTGSCNTKTAVISHTSGVYYTQSAVLEKGNTNFASMTFHYEISGAYAVFNLDTGVVVRAEGCTATIKEYTQGKYRCSITAASAATLNKASGYITPCREDSVRLQGVLGDYIYATKVQVETGQQMTSYIPTTVSSVTRAADVLHYDVSSAITQGQGSLYCEFYNIHINSGASRLLLCLSDGTSSNRLYFQINASNLLTFLVIRGGTTEGYISGSVSSVVGINKLLFTYADNNMRLYHNGATVGEDLSGIMGTTMIKLSVGCLENSTTQLNREIGNIKYFKEVLPPAEAIKLTTV